MDIMDCAQHSSSRVAAAAVGAAVGAAAIDVQFDTWYTNSEDFETGHSTSVHSYTFALMSCCPQKEHLQACSLAAFFFPSNKFDLTKHPFVV